jgi:hypothetical protein
MSDATPPPGSTDPTTGEPVAAATPAAATPAAAAPVTGRLHLVGARLRNRRTPLLLGGATLLLGCVLGAGVVAVGAVVFGGGHHGDDRSYSNSDHRGTDRSDNHGRNDDDENGDGHHKPTAAPSTPAAPSTAATPSASAGSPVPASS